MADDKVSLWGDTLKFGKSPASGEMLVGNGTGFTLTASNVVWGNPVEFTVPIKVDGQVWSTTTGFKFPDGTTQSSAATSYSPPSVANNTIQSNVSGGSAAPSANTLTQVLDGTASGTQGSLLYRNGSAWTALGPGTSGQVLTSGGSGANPSWANASGWTIVKKTANQACAGINYENDSELYFSVVSGTTYLIRGCYFSTAPSNIFNVALNGPSFSFLQAGPTYSQGQYVSNAYDVGFLPNGNWNKGANAFNGTITMTASGTLNVRIAGTNSTALKGSWIEYTAI